MAADRQPDPTAASRWLSNALCAVGLVFALVVLVPLAAFFWLIDGEVE